MDGNYGGLFCDYSFQSSEIFGELFSFKLGSQICLKILNSYVYPKLGDDAIFIVLNEKKFSLFEDLIKDCVKKSKNITDVIINPQTDFGLFEIERNFNLLDILELIDR